MLRIAGLRFRAVCDIWTEYNQRRVVNTLRRFKHEVNAYEDYREMLDKANAYHELYDKPYLRVSIDSPRPDGLDLKGGVAS